MFSKLPHPIPLLVLLLWVKGLLTSEVLWVSFSWSPPSSDNWETSAIPEDDLSPQRGWVVQGRLSFLVFSFHTRGYPTRRQL